MNLLLIAVIFLVALVVFVKAKEIRHHFFYRILGVLAILFAVSFIYVWVKSGSSFGSYEDFLKFGRLYFTWLSNISVNLKGVTGYAVQQGWGFNSTIVP